MKFLFAAIATALLLTACGTANGETDSRPEVVVSFYPLAFAAEQVGGNLVHVDNLTKPGVEPHDLELKPKQVASVQDADLLVYEKDFQAAVDQAVDQGHRSANNTIDVAQEVDLLPLSDSDSGEHSAHGAHDPHVWLDPSNMVAITKSISRKLRAIDPAHGSAYEKNAASFIARLKKLDAAFDEGLKKCSTRYLVTSHAAFGYLTDRYDLKQVPIAGVDPNSAPSAAQLARITKMVREKNIDTIFTEELVSPAIAKTIAHETGATTRTLDPIEGLSEDTKNDDYLSLMAHNLTVIEKANHCS